MASSLDDRARLQHLISHSRLIGRYETPQPCRYWVDLKGSMTREIAHHTSSEPSVRLLYQGPGRLTRWESRLLGIHPRRRAFIREISLTSRGERMLLARSVTALPSLLIPMLQGLGSKPLAELLFVDADWKRPDRPTALASGNTNPIYGRTAVWKYAGHRRRLLVSEFFLSELFGGH